MASDKVNSIIESIEGLNVLEPVFKTVSAQINFVFRDRVKHERVIGIGRMAESKNIRRMPHRRMLTAGGARATIADSRLLFALSECFR